MNSRNISKSALIREMDSDELIEYRQELTGEIKEVFDPTISIGISRLIEIIDNQLKQLGHD